MIPAPPGLMARFKYTGVGSEGTYTRYEDRRVYAFDDDGSPLIVASKSTHRLVPATQYSNYHGLVESAEDDYVALIPSGGWRCKTKYTGDNGKQCVSDEPLVAWALQRDGAVVPLWTDKDGLVDEVQRVSNIIDLVIYHPDQSCSEDAESNENIPTRAGGEHDAT